MAGAEAILYDGHPLRPEIESCEKRVAMKRSWATILLAVIASSVLACGGGRRLQSITISELKSGQQIQFVATGTFSAPPTTVSPLAVSWSFAPPPGQYTLTPQPFTFQCTFTGPYPSPLIAWAPSDPHAPNSGSMSSTKMITASTQITCP